MAALVDAVMLAAHVECPVRLEVPVVDDGAEPEEGLGSLHAPPGAGDAETVADQMPARALDRVIKLRLRLSSSEFVSCAGTRRAGLGAWPRCGRRRGCRSRRWASCGEAAGRP